MVNTHANNLNGWYTFDNFPKSHPNFKRSQIEWLHRNRHVNGFAKSFRKIGRLRYIHDGLFAECIIEQEESTS